MLSLKGMERDSALAAIWEKLSWRWYRFRLRAHVLGLATHPDRATALKYAFQEDVLLQNAETTPTNGDRISTICVTVVEYFTPSNIGRLHEHLEKLGLGRDLAFGNRDPQRWIVDARSAEGRSGWYNLGRIHRGAKRIYARGVLGPVPPSFEDIDISVHSVSPSLTACTLTFHLKVERRGVIRSELVKYRFPEFVSYGLAHSVRDAADVKAAAVDKFRRQLRSEIDRWVRKHLPGSFSAEPASRRPSLELTVYVQERSSEFSRSMWGLAGLANPEQEWQRGGEGGGRLVFPSRRKAEDATSALLFVNSADVTEDMIESYGEREAAIAYRLNREMRELILVWGFQALLASMRGKLSHARDNQLGLKDAKAASAVRRLQKMTIQNSDVKSVCRELQVLAKNKLPRDTYSYRGGGWAKKDARENLLAWFWSVAAKSARRLIEFDDEVRALAHQQGTLIVAEQNLKMQSLVGWLTSVTVVLALIAAYEPATKLWPKVVWLYEQVAIFGSANELPK